MTDTLLVDIGNSFVKCAAITDDATLGPVDYQTMDWLWSAIPRLKRVYLSSVGCEQQLNKLKQVCEEHKVNLFIPDKRRVAYGLKFSYPEIETLGLDRWLNCIAAYQEFQQDVVIMSLGTAVTVDFIRGDGTHLGGWIAPGLGLSASVLLSKTANIKANVDFQTEHLVGTNTKQCVELGCMAVLRGVVNEGIRVANECLGDPVIVITGGDQGLLKDLDYEVNWRKNTVIDGLFWLLQQE